MAQEGMKLLMSLIDSGDSGFKKFLDYQFKDEMFRGDEADVFTSVKKHALGYGTLPSRKTIKKFAKGKGISLPAPADLEEPAAYYYDKLEHRNLKLGLLKSMKAAEEHRMDNPQKSLDVLTSDIIDLNTHKNRTKLVNVVTDAAEIIHAEYTKAVLGGDKGLKFGWPTLDKMADGIRGGDLISIIGRPGMGKTYMALHAMINAWYQGYTCLFVSMEMNSTPVVQRVAAMFTGTSISELKAGQVAGKKYKRMIEDLDGMHSLMGGNGMWVADGRLSVSVEDLIMLCNQLKPDVVYIDGAYMLRHPDPRLRRFDRINSNTEDLKMMSEELALPLVQTFQFNRGMTKKKEVEDVDLEDIAGSDAIGQLSSLVMGTFQDDNVETLLTRKIRILKGRNGEKGEFNINWRFGGFGKKQDHTDTDVSDIMNFTEIDNTVHENMQFV